MVAVRLLCATSHPGDSRLFDVSVHAFAKGRFRSKTFSHW